MTSMGDKSLCDSKQLTGVKQRVDKISQNIKLGLEHMPTTAKIEVCSRCTLSCRFCFQAQMKSQTSRQSLMTDEDFAQVMRFIATVPSLKEVGLFYMGESGLHPKLADYYMQLKNAGYFTYLTTNGTCLEHVYNAIPYIDSLKVSWNYKSESDFVEKTRAPQALYSRIRDNISKLKNRCNELGKQLAVSTVLDTADRSEYNAALESLEFDEHYWIPLQTQCDVLSNATPGVVGQADNQRSPIPCWSLFKGLYIDSMLNVRTCCYGHHEEHVLYNIKDVESFYLHPTLIKMREIHLQNKIPAQCKQCLSCM